MSIATQLKGARAAARSRDYDQAEFLLRNVLQDEPDNVAALDLLGFVLYFRGRPAEAEQMCRRVLELEPNHAYAHKGLGLCIAKQGGDVEVALASIRRAIELEPNWFDPRWDLVVTLLEAGRFDEARAELEQGRAAFPDRESRWSAMQSEIDKRARPET
jgi:Flp pilus assembly protein TadD